VIILTNQSQKAHPPITINNSNIYLAKRTVHGLKRQEIFTLGVGIITAFSGALFNNILSKAPKQKLLPPEKPINVKVELESVPQVCEHCGHYNPPIIKGGSGCDYYSIMEQGIINNSNMVEPICSNVESLLVLTNV
jgi:hypothetical protein